MAVVDPVRDEVVNVYCVVKTEQLASELVMGKKLF